MPKDNYIKAGEHKGVTHNVIVRHSVDRDNVHRFSIVVFDRAWCRELYRDAYFVGATMFRGRDEQGWVVKAARYGCKFLPTPEVTLDIKITGRGNK